MVDLTRVRTLLERMELELDHLRRLARRDAAELIADDDLVAAVKYRFIVAIETAIDVAQHVVAARGLRAPTDYADVFAVLVDAGLLPEGHVGTFQDMARFRNLLLHGYAVVDDSRVVNILRTHIDDLATLRRDLANAALR